MGWATRRIFLAQAGAGLALSGCLSRLARDHLAVFDHIWSTVDRNYFDPGTNGFDWRAARGTWRPLAAKAESLDALYLAVLWPMLDQLKSSHVRLTPAKTVMIQAGQSSRLPMNRSGDRLPFLRAADEAGLGGRLTFDGQFYVPEITETSGPLARAGILAGQTLRVFGLRMSETGGRLQVRTYPDNRDRVVQWTRQPPQLSRETYRLRPGIQYLRFDEFQEPDVSWALAALSETTSDLVLDMRTNRGGLVTECGRFLRRLLPANASLGTFIDRNGTSAVATPPVAKASSVKQVVVLTGPRSVSGAELTACVLAHHQRAVLVGHRTAGALLLSRSFPTPDGGALLLPTADYRTPGGRRIEGVGVRPEGPSLLVNGQPDRVISAAVDLLTSA